MALVLPLLVLIMLGAFDFGFLFYASIAIENAARIAALDTSASLQTAVSTSTACADVTLTLQRLPNSKSFPTSCNALPLTVFAQQVIAPDGSAGSRVTVTYSTVQLFPVPWIAWMTPGQFTLTRTSTMRVRG